MDVIKKRHAQNRRLKGEIKWEMDLLLFSRCKGLTWEAQGEEPAQ